MAETEVGSVEYQAVGRRAAVEPVAQDGAAEAGGMGTVDAELVGAARVRNQPQERFAGSFHVEYFVFRDGWFSSLQVDHLPRPVVPVGRERQADLAAGSFPEWHFPSFRPLTALWASLMKS